MFKLGKRSSERLVGVHPDILFTIDEALKTSPIDIGIPRDGGVRTDRRQNEMYRDPDIKTLCDGYEQVSKHQVPDGQEYGYAFDFYAYIDGGASWKKVHLAMAAGAILSTNKRLLKEGAIKIELRWGASFGSKIWYGWDSGHMEAVKYVR